MSAGETIELQVQSASGGQAKALTVPADFFSASGKKALLHQYVRWQRNKKRAGTHKVKTRAEVAGGGAKPWKQKGTGRARAGSNTSPLWVGGGVAHGPKLRNYEFHLNKKERRGALRTAISQRFHEERLILVDDLGLSEIKTKAAAEVLAKLGVGRGEKALVVLPDSSAEQYQVASKSLRNLPGVKPIQVAGLNVYDVLGAKYLVVVGEAFEGVRSRVGS